MKGFKMRDVEALHGDPRFDYMVGRLVGATEMLSFYMALHGDEKMRGMADRGMWALQFFYDQKDPPRLPPPASEQDTKVLQPRGGA